jgi:undecaprenyl-phosphate 4-deoxy-4-formamido-L-arabinose transferase
MSEIASAFQLTIIIPCFNSEGSIRLVVQDILAEVNLGNIPRALEIILVNDASLDGTDDQIKLLESEFPEVKRINLAKNYGQHVALLAGVSLAKGGLIVTMDDDGQHVASEIPKLLREISTGHDLVYGVAVSEEHDMFRNLSSKLTKNFMFRSLGIPHAKEISAFRIFKKELLSGIELQGNVNSMLDVILRWNTSQVSSISVIMEKRKIGKSNYNFRKLLVFALSVIFSYSVRPLRIATFLGIFFFLTSALLSVYFVVEYLRGNIGLIGFTTITVLITTLSSVQLLTLGIFGEYLINIHQKSMGKPLFRIQK